MKRTRSRTRIATLLATIVVSAGIVALSSTTGTRAESLGTADVARVFYKTVSIDGPRHLLP